MTAVMISVEAVFVYSNVDHKMYNSMITLVSFQLYSFLDLRVSSVQLCNVYLYLRDYVYVDLWVIRVRSRVS